MEPPKLVQISGCDPKNRYEKWNKEGGPLLGNQNIGCGLNALAFLGVFTRAEGEHLVRIINPGGTSFAEMISFVFRWSKHPIFEGTYPVTTQQDIMALEMLLTDAENPFLSPGHCTVAKFMRYADGAPPKICNGQHLTSGHSVVLSNIGGKLTVIDPQQKTFREHKSDKALKAWNNSCYTHVSLMFGHPNIAEMKAASPMKAGVFEQQAAQAFPVAASSMVVSPARFVAAEVPSAAARFVDNGTEAAWFAYQAREAERAAAAAAAFEAERAAAAAAAAKAAFDNPRVGNLVAAARLRSPMMPPPAPPGAHVVGMYDGPAADPAKAAAARAKIAAENERVKREAEHEAMLRHSREMQRQAAWYKPHVRGLQPSPLDSYWGYNPEARRLAGLAAKAAEARTPAEAARMAASRAVFAAEDKAKAARMAASRAAAEGSRIKAQMVYAKPPPAGRELNINDESHGRRSYRKFGLKPPGVKTPHAGGTLKRRKSRHLRSS
jgi:hypothetical protein